MELQNEIATLVVDLHYFPSVNYYKTLIEYDILNFEQYEHYRKHSCRNRCYIAGPGGVQLLTVPLVKGKNQRTILKDIRIANNLNWQTLHWKTLGSAYRSSPWFEYFEEGLRPYYEKRVDFLLDWNLKLFDLVSKWLGIRWQVGLTNEYIKHYAQGGSTDLRDSFPVTPVSSLISPYTQVFGERTGFLPGLSILDLIFCEGKGAAGLLAGSQDPP